MASLIWSPVPCITCKLVVGSAVLNRSRLIFLGGWEGRGKTTWNFGGGGLFSYDRYEEKGMCNSRVECVTPRCSPYSWGKCSHSLMENVWKTFILLHQAGLNALPLRFRDRWSHSTYQMGLYTSVCLLCSGVCSSGHCVLLELRNTQHNAWCVSTQDLLNPLNK